jgi:hypothetical protein
VLGYARLKLCEGKGSWCAGLTTLPPSCANVPIVLKSGGLNLLESSGPVQACNGNQWRTQEFFSGGSSTNSVEDRGQRERGSGGGSLLVRGSGGSCNLVQEISFHIVKFS